MPLTALEPSLFRKFKYARKFLSGRVAYSYHASGGRFISCDISSTILLCRHYSLRITETWKTDSTVIKLSVEMYNSAPYLPEHIWLIIRPGLRKNLWLQSNTALQSKEGSRPPKSLLLLETITGNLHQTNTLSSKPTYSFCCLSLVSTKKLVQVQIDPLMDDGLMGEDKGKYFLFFFYLVCRKHPHN